MYLRIFFLLVFLLTIFGCPIPNYSPEITGLYAYPKTVSLESSNKVTIKVYASDANGDTLSYSWSCSGGTINGSGNSIEWYAPQQIGTYTVSVTVSDGKGGFTASSIEISVILSGIVITDISANPNPVSLYSSTTLSVEVYNPDGYDLSYSWFGLGHVLGTERTVLWYTGSCYCSIGVHTITVEVHGGQYIVSDAIDVEITSQ